MLLYDMYSYPWPPLLISIWRFWFCGGKWVLRPVPLRCFGGRDFTFGARNRCNDSPFKIFLARPTFEIDKVVAPYL